MNRSMYHGFTPPNDALADQQKSLLSPSVPTGRTATTTTEATAGTLLASRSSPMERGTAPDYSQSGLPSPFPSQYGDTRSEGSSADQQSAAAAVTTSQFPNHAEVRSSNYSTSATPGTDYNGLYPGSARSGSFPEQIHRSYHIASNSGGGAGMAQQANSPSMSQQDGRHHQSPQLKSDSQLPIDPSIAAPSPTYAYGQAHSPCGPPGDMTHGYQYQQPRPEWGNYGQHGGQLTPSGHVFPPTPSSAQAQSRPSQVYNFVPIPGTQQHKRPRRRYEEIERMYKCGWNGCEKAYGTLNHLNAHVTMQSHGTKRTPEEFKEIRKEWKQRKKEEEAQRKAEEERQRQAAAAAAAQSGTPEHGGTDGGGAPPPTTYQNTRALQLPPIGYSPTTYAGPGSATMPQQPLGEYGGSQVYPNYPPPSPYGQPGQSMYSQPSGGQPSSQ